MTATERNELLVALAQDYLCEKENNKVWQRENSSGYSIALGKLMGACTALKLDVDESEKELTILTRHRRRIVIRIEK